MPKRFETDSPTFDEIRALRKPRTHTVWVPMDEHVIGEIEALEKQIRVEERQDEAQHRRPVAPKLRKRLDELTAKADEAAVPFALQEIPRRVYRALIDVHPAQADDEARGIKRWHEDGFAPALIAVSTTQPELSTIPRSDLLELIASGAAAEDIRAHIAPAVEVWDDWPASVAYMLFGAAYDLQEGETKIPFTVRSSSETPGSPLSSTTAPAEG